MKKPNKKEALRRKSIEKLTKSALGLFVEKGYYATSLESISAEADLTKGAIFFYFSSKENLALHLFEVLEKNIVDPLVSSLSAEAENHFERVINYIHTGAQFGIDRPNELLFMIQASIEFNQQDNAIGAAIRKLYKRLYDALEEVVEEGMKQNEFLEGKPSELVATIVAVHDGMMLEWHRRKGEINGAHLVRNTRLMFQHGIRNRD